MKTFTRLFLVTIIALSLFNLKISTDGISFSQKSVFAQQINSVWTDKADFTITDITKVMPVKYRYLSLDLNSIRNILANSPFEFTDRALSSPLIIELPHPDGGMSKFYVTEYSMMEPGLAEQFPEIKTFNVKGIDDPYAVGKIDVTYAGFHGMVLTPNGDYFIDPVSIDNTENYISFFKSDFLSTQPFECLVDETIDNSALINSHNSDMTGQQLRTYRLACAATGEYTVFHGGTVALGQAAIVTAINRVNQVYERDMSVRMTLVANNNLIIYTNGGTDPYSNNDGFTMLGQNQSNITTVIGSANYDIGHVFSTGGGGVASLGVVCNSTTKARGVTGLPSPIGDPFYIDYVAHEMGHQYSGNHSFNGNAGSCGGGRNASTAWEPGSGSTIMAYAGICGAQNLQSFSDAYFHTGSVSEITAFTQTGGGNSCPVITNTGNTPPTVTVPAGGFTIPISTPFALTGSATDTENPGTLTYCWEEFDLGAAGNPNSPVGNAPIFRSFDPVVSSSRTFPKLSDLINNTATIGEILPTYTRNLTFRLTVRDNNTGGGGINFGTVAFNVSNTSGPFVVTQPNTAVSWNSGSQTVNWNIANTTSAPVSCALVNIKLSTDGGNTFPTTLLSNTANDGSEVVTIPNISTTTARIKVESVGNVFFDISNTNFTIIMGLSPAPCEDFTTGTFPPPPFTVEFTGTNHWSRNAVSAYGTGSGSAKFDFFNAGPTLPINQSLVSNEFSPVGANTFVTFDQAYAPYSVSFPGPDTLLVEASSNAGASYTVLATLLGKIDGTGELNTAPPIASAFTPVNSQWRPQIYSLPVGTNKVRLKAKSGYGNNLYVDNLCVQTLAAPVSSFLGCTPQGFYRGTPDIYSGIPDTIKVYLHRSDFPNVIADSLTTTLSALTSVNVVYSKALSGTYYIVVKHRNSIETWSKAGGEAYTRGATLNFDFLGPNSAFNNNQYQVNVISNLWGMFGGDVDRNNFVDGNDVIMVSNDAGSFTSGYVQTDVTGDNITDLDDILLTHNNSVNFVSREAPPGADFIPEAPVMADPKNIVFENDSQRQKYESGFREMANRKNQVVKQYVPNWSPMPSQEYLNKLREARKEKISEKNISRRVFK